jgi:hypothetical protein
MARSRVNRCRRYKRGDLTFRWCGGRTINVFHGRQEIDVISFGYSEGDERPTPKQARKAIDSHMRYRRGEDG